MSNFDPRRKYSKAELEQLLRIEKLELNQQMIKLKRQLNSLSREFAGCENRMKEIEQAENLL